MPTPTSRFDRLIADYLQALERGERPDRVALLSAHPELAAELRAFFADHDRMKGLAEAADVDLPTDAYAPSPLPVDPEGPTLPRSSPAPEAPSSTRVRYFGDYELLDEIARGGMGVVFKAKQT